MSDFVSSYWNWHVIVLTALSILACFWLVRWMSSGHTPSKDGETEDTGHVWDEDLRELNNPLPRWWLGMFYITLFFSVGYLALYPGMGTFKGWLGWTSANAYESEMQLADDTYGPLFKQFQAQDLVAVSKDEQAQKIGKRLFLNYCATCHGSDARGARGFPNLRDDDWLWGGEADMIKASILNGRTGVMPAQAVPLGGEQGVADMANYVLSLSGREHNAEAAGRAKEQFMTFCAACHTPEGTGNHLLGAPNLTDKTWLYGGTQKTIMETITNGRNGHMPPHGEFLGEDKVHLLAAYVYGLSEEK